jgi:hypothetical protein
MLAGMDWSFTLVFGGFVLIWTIGLIIGMAYLRGGLGAVRLVAPRLAILIPILVLTLVVQAIVTSKVGAMTVGLVLLPVVLVTLVLQIRRYRHIRATAPDDVRASVAFTPPIRTFAIIAFVIMLVGSFLLAFLASRAGL